MRLLVAGGAGFLGGHLCRELLNLGHDVTCLDNFSSGNLSNIEDLLTKKNFKVIEHDVRTAIDLSVDGIFNLACPASPITYQRDPIQTLTTSFLGTLNLLELAERRKIALLQASTSEIYGDPTVSPQSEIYWGNCNPIGVRACYDEGKRAGETLCADYKRQYGTDTKVARIFNTYGPNMALDDGRVVSNFIFQALTGRDLTIYGDGNQIRSFCYVDDLIDGLIKLFFSSNVDGPVNLGNPEPLTMNLLAREVIELTNTKSAIVFLELPGDDPITREPDITKARNLLGFKPIVGRREGLKKTISNFQARIDA